jgi:hypothetical protein
VTYVAFFNSGFYGASGGLHFVKGQGSEGRMFGACSEKARRGEGEEWTEGETVGRGLVR